MGEQAFSWVEVSELIAEGTLQVEDGNHGEYRPRREEFVQDGVAFIRAADMNRTRIHFAQAEKIDETAFSRIRKGIGAPLDVLLSHKGTVGKVALAQASAPKFVCSPQTTFWRSLDRQKINPKFLFYTLQSDDFRRQLLSRQSESDMAPYVSLTEQRKLSLRLISIDDQVAVSAVLGALDDKITLSEKISNSCDRLKSLRFSQYLANFFERIREAPLSSAADFINGRAFTKDATGTGRMVVRIAEINSGPGASTVYNDIEVPDQHLVHPGDILFAWSGSLSVTRWFRPEAIINQHIFKVLPRQGVPKWLAFELTKAKLEDFRMIAAGKATTMGHIQRHHLDELVLTPANGDIARLDEELGPLWDRALAAEREALTLADLRNTLLPKLMSGEIRVRDAEKAVEEAT